METEAITLIGLDNEIIPIVIPVGSVIPSQFVADYESYCGAGKGFGDVIVPETMWGLKISPACWVHDRMWEMCDPSWSDFHHSNSVFLRNIISCVSAQSKSQWLKRLRLYRAVTYYNAVDSAGKYYFWKCKEGQLEQRLKFCEGGEGSTEFEELAAQLNEIKTRKEVSYD